MAWEIPRGSFLGPKGKKYKKGVSKWTNRPRTLTRSRRRSVRWVEAVSLTPASPGESYGYSGREMMISQDGSAPRTPVIHTRGIHLDGERRPKEAATRRFSTLLHGTPGRSQSITLGHRPNPRPSTRLLGLEHRGRVPCDIKDPEAPGLRRDEHVSTGLR